MCRIYYVEVCKECSLHWKPAFNLIEEDISETVAEFVYVCQLTETDSEHEARTNKYYVAPENVSCTRTYIHNRLHSITYST